jgi:hypothetical protein
MKHNRELEHVALLEECIKGAKEAGDYQAVAAMLPRLWDHKKLLPHPADSVPEVEPTPGDAVVGPETADAPPTTLERLESIAIAAGWKPNSCEIVNFYAKQFGIVDGVPLNLLGWVNEKVYRDPHMTLAGVLYRDSRPVSPTQWVGRGRVRLTGAVLQTEPCPTRIDAVQKLARLIYENLCTYKPEEPPEGRTTLNGFEFVG